jgi:hypothetical protein
MCAYTSLSIAEHAVPWVMSGSQHMVVVIVLLAYVLVSVRTPGSCGVRHRSRGFGFSVWSPRLILCDQQWSRLLPEFDDADQAGRPLPPKRCLLSRDLEIFIKRLDGGSAPGRFGNRKSLEVRT